MGNNPEFSIEKEGETVLSGVSSECQVEVDQGGWGGQFGDHMLVSAIVCTVGRIGDGPNTWKAAETIHLSLDREAARWLSEALAGVVSGAQVGVRRRFS